MDSLEVESLEYGIFFGIPNIAPHGKPKMPKFTKATWPQPQPQKSKNVKIWFFIYYEKMSEYKVIRQHFEKSETAVVLNDYFTNPANVMQKLEKKFPHPDYNIAFFRGISLLEKL